MGHAIVVSMTIQKLRNEHKSQIEKLRNEHRTARQSAWHGPAPPPTCHLGGVDLLTNKATRERTGGRATLKMTRGAKCGLSYDWLESGEDPKLSTFSIHSVACDKDLIFGKVPRRPPNHVGQYRCGRETGHSELPRMQNYNLIKGVHDSRT